MPPVPATPPPAQRAQIAPYVASAGAVLVVALAAYVLTRFVSLPHVSVLFVAPVVMSAALWGLWPAVFAAILSVAASSYFFYSPILDFRIARPQDIADLAVFVIVAAFTSRLAASVREKALEAHRRQQWLSGLLAFAERLAASGSDSDLHGAIVEHLAPVFGEPVHLFVPQDAKLSVAASLPAGGATSDDVREAAERAMAGAASAPDGWRLERLDTAHGPVAVIAARDAALAADPDYASAQLGQAALALERARLRRDIGEARLKMQGEALREALLSSVSHDLQTPLAGILGSVTALQTIGDQASAGTRTELLTTIREEAERLTAHIENVLDLTRIRTGQVPVRLELVEIADIINAALRRKRRQLRDHEVRLRIPPDLPMVRLDLFLMEHALGNVLDNAAKYAPPGSIVVVEASQQDSTVVLDVSDVGSGIAADELPRVFDAFYRGGDRGRPAAGSGLGLAICRAFVDANGGSVEVLSGGAARGTTVRFRLPLPEAVPASESAISDE